MKKSDKPYEHPEVMDIKNICRVSPHNQNTEDVCDKIHDHKKSRAKKKRIKKDKELDIALKETFPASDPVTKY